MPRTRLSLEAQAHPAVPALKFTDSSSPLRVTHFSEGHPELCKAGARAGRVEQEGNATLPFDTNNNGGVEGGIPVLLKYEKTEGKMKITAYAYVLH